MPRAMAARCRSRSVVLLAVTVDLKRRNLGQARPCGGRLGRMDVKGYQGSVSFDGQTVTVSKRGRGAVSVPVDRVTSVEITRAGVMLSAIRFSVAGGSERGRARVVGSTSQVMRDPYSLAFRKKRAAEFEALRDAVLAKA